LVLSGCDSDGGVGGGNNCQGSGNCKSNSTNVLEHCGSEDCLKWLWQGNKNCNC
jgi:hypothetical protein